MNKKDLLVVAAVVVLHSIVGGFVGVKVFAPQLAGDFPGGVLPTNLLNGNAGAGYVYQVGSLALGAPNGLYTGGLNPNNEMTALYAATTTYPVGTITLGGYQKHHEHDQHEHRCSFVWLLGRRRG
jgi:hypothetical protein